MKIKICFAFVFSIGVLHADWKPVEGRIMTQWAKELTPENTWQEYPRPLLQREQWKSLNGLWDYQISTKGSETPKEWAGKILVPFPLESALSGVGKLLAPDEALWYRRTFAAAKNPEKRLLIHFEAVDYETTVWLNGKEIGSHTGGHTPFSFDLTSALQDGDNELSLRVHDATGKYQLTGKQHLNPHGIWYTRVSGIWQSVWTEEVNRRSIETLDFTSDISAGTIGITPKLSGTPVEGEKLRITASHKGNPAGTVEGSGTLSIKIANPQLWSPETPNLYDLQVELLDGDGKVIDSAKSYTALRELGKKQDQNGNWRFTLNGNPYFHWGPLDQGWWPDGLLTPPSELAMLSDIKYLKEAGFNMIRKHIKIEPRRFYYDCDRIGMLVWQDQVNAGPMKDNPPWIFLAPNPKEGEWPDEAHEQYVVEYKRMVDHLRNHPSIVVWSPFNEAWGQHRSLAVGKMAVDYDKTRPINIASGGNFWPVGDIADMHAYPEATFPFRDERFKDYIKVVGEFGGHGWPVKGHLWDAKKENWGYGALPKTLDEWKARYTRSIKILSSLRKQGVAAGVYTQTTDVEGEINGLLTYDRLEKVPASWLKPLHDAMLATPDAVTHTPLAATSEKEAQTWKFTTDAPAGGWEKPEFDDSAWQKGRGGFGTKSTPNTKVGTVWSGREIWLRRSFETSSKPKGKLVLRIFHDEDATVFFNGTEVARLPGHTSNYVPIDLDGRAAAALKEGENILAIHVKQTEGGQFIDAGLMDEVEVK